MPGPHGAILTLVLEGGDARALQVLRRLEVAIEATSLGGVESLASVPFNSSHFNMTPQERLDSGILPGMLRLSIRLEGEQAVRRPAPSTQSYRLIVRQRGKVHATLFLDQNLAIGVRVAIADRPRDERCHSLAAAGRDV